MTDQKTAQSRRTFLIVLAVFALPVILAKFALTENWFNRAVTNQGQLEQGLTLTDIEFSHPLPEKMWLLIYAPTGGCQQQCLNTLKGMNNTHIALGKDLSRLTPVFSIDTALTEQINAAADSKYWLKLSALPLNRDTLRNRVWVVDPLGNLILSYALPESQDNIADFGKAMLADLRKLLKYSKIG